MADTNDGMPCVVLALHGFDISGVSDCDDLLHVFFE